MDCTAPLSLVFYLLSHACSEYFQNGIRPFSLSATTYLILYALTNLLEFPVYFIFLKRLHPFSKIIWICLILNTATHPFVCLVFPSLFQHWNLSVAQYVCISETFAPLVEGLILALAFRIPLGRSLFASFSANLFSWLFGSYLVARFWV